MSAVLRTVLILFVATVLLLGGFHSRGALAAPTTPTADFTDNGDGTVTHKITGLTWKRCAEGQTWTGSTCTGTSSAFNWAKAYAATSTFAGKSDWRLPTIAELTTIAEYDSIDPSINSTIFPNPSSNSGYWSASVYAGDSSDAWGITTSGTVAAVPGLTIYGRVRLVRGGQPLGTSGLYTPTADFSDSGNGTITHKKTGLMWKRCSEGQNWSGICTGTAATYTWAEAGAVTSSAAGYTDWRLPTVSELLTIVEWSMVNPAINPSIFPNTSTSTPYWSASIYSGATDDAWRVVFADPGQPLPGESALGYLGTAHNTKTSSGHVRLVRGTRSDLTAVPVALSLSCTATLASGTGGSCRATASYADGTSKMVSPIWSSSNAAALYIDSHGGLVAGTPSADTTVSINASYTENGVTKTASQSVTVFASKTTAAATLTGLSAACPTALAGGASGACSATASYSNGTTKAVSATWISSNSTALSVNSSGSLAAGTPGADTIVTISASYTENGVTKTASQNVTVKIAAVLTGLSATCTAAIPAGAGGQCSATASYSNGMTKEGVEPIWSSSSTVLTVAYGGYMYAGMPSADTVVTITASYTENGVTKIATQSVTVFKATAVALTSLSVTCATTLVAGASGGCGAMATYSDGANWTVTPIWSSSNPTMLSVGNDGSLAAGTPSTDTTVTISASYTKNGVTKTASQSVTIKAAAALPAGFTDNGDGTVTHKTTGLTWKRCAEGQTWTGSTCSGKAQTYTWDAAMALGTGGWGLPTKDQLLAIVEAGHGSPAINLTVFPTTSGNFWSSTPMDRNGGGVLTAWSVSFGPGYASASLATSINQVPAAAYQVRLVNATLSATASDAERVFNWAESVYPQYFYPAKPPILELQGYTYRFYNGSGNYLAVKDGKLWLLGPVSGNSVLDAGALADWLSKAKAAGY